VDAIAISENSSKTTRRNRGRPRSETRVLLTNLGGALGDVGCLRTQVSGAFRLAVISAIKEAGPDAQRAIWGYTESEIVVGKGRFPPGWKVAADAAGRYLAASGAPGVDVARVMEDARKRGISFGDIAAHYRALRLGEREGNPAALAGVLLRAVNDYWKRFPKTTPQQLRDAALVLLNHLKKMGDA